MINFNIKLGILLDPLINNNFYRKSKMYSKYLDYTDSAIKSHQLAQVEN